MAPSPRFRGIPTLESFSDPSALVPDSSAPERPANLSPSSIGSPAEPSRWFAYAVVGIALFVGLNALRLHWVPNKWLFGDGSFYMNVANGILENGSLRQEGLHPHSWYDRDLGWNGNVDAAWSNIALGRNGEWWPKHPVLMPLCAAPFIWAFGPAGSLLFQFLCFLGMAFFAYRAASRVTARPAALAAAAAFVVTPWIADRVWGFNNDVFYTVLILAALDAALCERALLAGALLGIGVFAKNTNVLYGPALVGLFLLRKDWRGAFKFCVAAAIPALAYLGLNAYLFGSPFKTGYDRILVREAGRLTTHSHAADFHFRALVPSVKRVLLGPDGVLRHFPLFLPAVLGLGVLLVRRWREALVVAWCLAVPLAFHAPYTWYRLEFNLPQLAMAVIPLAALLAPMGRPFDDPFSRRRIRWARLVAVAGAAALLLIGGARRLLLPAPDYLWRELPHAQVFLGDIPCDYYNNQTERWECSHYDNDWLMTGRPLEHDLRFNGQRDQVLLFHPHTTGRERTLVYSNVPLGKVLRLRYGLADRSRPDASVHFKVLVDGTPLLDEEVRGRGLVRKDLDTSAVVGKRATVTFSVQSPDANGAVFVLNGGPAER